MRTAIVVTFLMIASSVVWASEAARHASPYQGQERRAVKSLAEAEVADLLAGRGAGFAKAAELNGVPGPAHLLEMKTEIALTAQQEARIEAVRKRMQAEAVALGRRLVDLETELNAAFAAGTATKEGLGDLLTAIASVERDLRFAHLAAHLETPAIVTPEQILTYNRLRGYATAADPCAQPPAGHDPARWRQHNNCPN
jgi:Spy/CpxP family protein refolding chaperone